MISLTFETVLFAVKQIAFTMDPRAEDDKLNYVIASLERLGNDTSTLSNIKDEQRVSHPRIKEVINKVLAIDPTDVRDDLVEEGPQNKENTIKRRKL
jgi:hypothetical protein